MNQSGQAWIQNGLMDDYSFKWSQAYLKNKKLTFI